MFSTGSIRPRLAFAALALAALALAGCAASGPPPAQATNGGTRIGDAQVQSKMSTTIFLQPVVDARRVIYVEGHNTSSAQRVNFLPTLQQALFAQGYRLTRNPSEAEFILQYNLRYLGKETESHTATGAIAGAAGGAIIEGAAGGSWHQSARAGIIGAGIGALVGYMMSENQYLMVVDIKVQQRAGDTAGSTWQVHRARVAAEAAGRHLQFGYARPALEKSIARAIAGIF